MFKFKTSCHYQYIALVGPHNGYDLDIMTNARLRWGMYRGELVNFGRTLKFKPKAA
jgi:hypothetical protein